MSNDWVYVISVKGVKMSDDKSSDIKWKFREYTRYHRELRHWTHAHLARKAQLAQPEICRSENGERQPTLRVVMGLARAYSGRPHKKDDADNYADWLVLLADLAASARTSRSKS